MLFTLARALGPLEHDRDPILTIERGSAIFYFLNDRMEDRDLLFVSSNKNDRKRIIEIGIGDHNIS